MWIFDLGRPVGMLKVLVLEVEVLALELGLVMGIELRMPWIVAPQEPLLVVVALPRPDDVPFLRLVATGPSRLRCPTASWRFRVVAMHGVRVTVVWLRGWLLLLPRSVVAASRVVRRRAS